FRRRGGADSAAVPGAAEAAAPPAGSTTAAPVAVPARPARRAWARLAPLPLLSGAPPLTTSTDLVPPPLPGPPMVPAPEVPPPALARGPARPAPRRARRGRGRGPRAPPPAQPGPAQRHDVVAPLAPEHAAPEAHRPALVHRPVLAQPPAPGSLVTALDEYVGEPREGDGPYRPPAWMRSGPPAWLLPTGGAHAFGLPR